MSWKVQFPCASCYICVANIFAESPKMLLLYHIIETMLFFLFLWTLVWRNLNTLISYSRTSIRDEKGTYFDTQRFVIIDIASSYVDLIERFREFKKVYTQSIDGKNKFTWTATFALNFPSYVLSCYDSLVRGRFWYFLNSWVYTTNHKRIAVNYFWFVKV